MSFYTDIYFLSVLILMQKLQCYEAENCQIAFCQYCVSSEECAVCELGRFGHRCEYECRAGDFTCSMCRDSFLKGLITLAAECNGCRKNEYFFRGQCLQCPRTCVSCVHQENCNECSDKFVETNCSNDCPTKCLNCSSHVHCTSCKNGWSGRSCQCSSNCARLEIEEDWCGINGTCLKGCRYNKKGIKCDTDCPRNKNCLQCDQMTGHCLLCSNGFYGSSCNKVCGHCQPNNEGYIRCNISNGECHGTCANRYYGRHCDKKCGNCLPDDKGISKCDFDTGYCNACIDGFYGKRCDKKCGHCQADKQSPLRCEMESGTCLNGCMDGYCGSICDTMCCHHLLNNTDVANCKNETVELNISCNDGFYGQFCDKKCPEKCFDPLTNTNKCTGISGNCTFGCTPGRYGDVCKKTCSNSCLNMTCNQQSGECSDGCVTGWYGENCQFLCSNTCFNDICDNFSASCSNGCVLGWYGVTCNKTCHFACFNSSCNQQWGHCDYGCIDGFYGHSCENTCNDNCKNTMCDRYTFNCTLGCKPGFLGPFCNVTQNASDGHVNPLQVGIIGGTACILLFVFLLITWVVMRRRKRVRRHCKVRVDSTDAVYNEIDDTVLQETFIGEGFKEKSRRECDLSLKQLSCKRTEDCATGIYDLPMEMSGYVYQSITGANFDVPSRTFQAQTLDIHTTENLSDGHGTNCLCSNPGNLQANEYIEFEAEEITKVKGNRSTRQGNINEIHNQETTTSSNSSSERNSFTYLHPIS